MIKTRQTLIRNNLNGNDLDDYPFADNGIMSLTNFLGIPVLYGEEIVGVICLLNRKEGYSDKHLVYHTPIASTCGQIIAARWEREKRESAEKELEMLATQDALTKIANRHSFNQFIAEQWERLQETKLPVSIIMIDIDCFKNYNDYYGHQAGDECLEKVAALLKEVALRPTDMAARYGGEEFVVVLADTFVDGAAKVARLVSSKLENLAIPHMDSPIAPYVTLSMGIADCIPDAKNSPQNLIAVADECLYAAKNEGRNKVVCKSLKEHKSIH